MEAIQSMMESVSEKLASVAQSDVVVGSPLEIGGLTVVPISRVSVGFGAGGGSGQGPVSKGKPHKGVHGTGKGTGGGSGGAGKVRPVAVAVLSKEGVEILPIEEKQGPLDRLLEKIPELVERFKEFDED